MAAILAQIEQSDAHYAEHSATKLNMKYVSEFISMLLYKLLTARTYLALNEKR